MSRVTKAEYLKDYEIKLVFDDNKTGVADLSELINTDKRALIQELANKKKFADFSIACNSLAWKNGVDISPEYLSKLVK